MSDRQVVAMLSAVTILAIVAMVKLPASFLVLSEERNYEAFKRHDPATGLSVEVPERDVLGGELADRDTLVIVLGSCGSCSVNSFDPSKYRRYGLQICAIVSAPTKTVQTWARSQLNSSGLHYVANACWFPRLYVIGSDKRLKWIQPSPRTGPESIL